MIIIMLNFIIAMLESIKDKYKSKHALMGKTEDKPLAEFRTLNNLSL
jgi:hypothetical protein